MSETKKYKRCYVDFDTVLFRAAKSLQEDYIVVTRKSGGKWSKEFSGVRKFYGFSNKTKDGGWIKEQNDKRELAGKPLISADDFDIEFLSRLKALPEQQNHVEEGLTQIDFKVGSIKKYMDAEDYVLVIGSLVKTYRFDVAKIVPYKGERKAKPILFMELREAFLNKYKNKVMIARDGLEADDEVSIVGWKSYKQFLKTGEYPYIISYVDKDIAMTPCPAFNYDETDCPIRTPTILECARKYAGQLISGDNVDNIKGLPSVSPEFAKKYGFRRMSGIGKATALELVEGCNTPKELYSRVVEAYKSHYGEEPFEFTSFDEEVSVRTWLDMLRENASLLYMCRSFKEANNYDIEDTLKRLGVDYD